MNKPRPDLLPDQQKTLIKLQFRDSDSGQTRDRVLDFTGDERFANVVRCEELLRQYAGDKAEERRLRLKRETEAVSRRRTEFLAANPDMLKLYEYVISPDGGGLTIEEFWQQYSADDVLDEDSKNESVIPIPLRPIKEEGPVSSESTTVLSDERKEGIFQQFPKVAQLYAQLVPISISEKSFWRRFFHSQYFNLTQGVPDGGGGSDVVFDSLISSVEQPKLSCLDAEIDLCQDEKNYEKKSEPFSTFLNRFNSSSAASFANSTRLADDSLVDDILNKRRVGMDLEEGMPKTLSRAEIEKLSLTRTLVSRKFVDFARYDQSELARPGMAGTAASTVAMTTELVDPGSDKILKKKIVNKEIDEYLDRVIELSKFFFASRISQVDRRTKLITNLNKLKFDLHNYLIPKLENPSEWLGTISMINSIVGNVELVNANIS